MIFVCAILGFSLDTSAQCKQINGAVDYSKFDAFGNTARKIHYFIESDFHTELSSYTTTADDSTLSQAQLARAVQEAAETWNNEALGQQLVYGGLVNIEDRDEICTATNKRPVVFVNFWPSSPSASGTLAKVDGCDKAAALTIFGSTNGNNHNWGVGSQGVQTGRKDLYGTLVHEFGHAVEIGHGHELSPPKCHGIMSYPSECPGRPGVRHLRGYDQECSTAFQNPRRAKYYTTRFNSAGNLMFPPAYLPTVGGQPLRTDRGFHSAGVTRAWNSQLIPRYLLWGERIGQSANVWWTPVDTNGLFSWSLVTSLFQPLWYTNFYTTPTFGSVPEISYARSTFNHPYYFYPTDYGQPLQRWGLSSNDYVNISYGGNFVRCSDISCSTSIPIRGFLPLTSGYNPKTNTTMVIDTRTFDNPNPTVISVYPGFYNNNYATLLPGTTFTLGSSLMAFPAGGPSMWTYGARPLRSAVTACSDHTFEREFNCMLAWAEPGKADGRILYSFYKHMPGQTPAIQFELENGKRKVHSRGGSDTVTTPGIAFFGGSFWLAFKRADATNTIAFAKYSSSGWSATSTIDVSSYGDLADPPSFGYEHNKEAVMSWTVVE